MLNAPPRSDGENQRQRTRRLLFGAFVRVLLHVSSALAETDEGCGCQIHCQAARARQTGPRAGRSFDRRRCRVTVRGRGLEPRRNRHRQRGLERVGFRAEFHDHLDPCESHRARGGVEPHGLRRAWRERECPRRRRRRTPSVSRSRLRMVTTACPPVLLVLVTTAPNAACRRGT